MSVYPRFNSSSVYNSQDVISYEEVSAGNTVVSLDLSSFVQKTAPVFESELYLKENVGINMNGIKQSTAFTDEYKSDLENNKEKLTAIDYANNITVVSQNLDLTGATVSLNDDQIGQEKITNLVTRLTDIDTNLANINSNDTDIANLNTTTATHTAQLTAIESKNDTQDGRLDTTETDVQNIKIFVLDAETDISNLESKDTQHDASLNDLFGLTTTLTNDVVSLNNMDTDISTNLNNYKISNDASIVLINDDITAIQTLNVSQNSRLDAVETLNTTQDDRLDAVESKNVIQDSRLDAVESKNVIQDTSINLLETLTASHTSDLTNLNSIQNANIANITTLQGENTTQASQISTLEGQIITKHPTINNSNKLNATYVGNGDVSNAKLSALNDIRTDVSIQNQINTINTSITGLDALQDLDLINIPILQSDVADLVAKDITVDASLNELATDIATNVSAIATNASDIASNVASLNTTNTSVNNNANSISVLNTNVASLVSADGIHDTQISDLQTADTVLQANIDLKEDIISLANKLDTTKIFDTGLNDSLNAILSTVDSNITLLNSSKQDNITTLNKLNTSLLNRDDNLLFCDATSSIQGQINAINSNISLLQGVDTTIISDIQANFDTHDASITANTNAISTLQGLQDGDVVSFNSINSSITNLTNTKHPLIDTNNKLNSSLINRDDNLQHIDITSSLQGKLNSLDTDIASKQNVIDNSNKLDATLLNLNNNLQYADYGSSVTTKFASIDSSISSLNANDVSQATTNTNLQNSINSNASDITDLQNNKHDVIDTNNKLSISNVDLTGSDLANMDYSNGSLTTKLNTLQSNIDNIDLSSKQDVIDTNNKLSISNVDLGSSALSYVDITAPLQTQLDNMSSSSGSNTLKFSGAGVDIFNHLNFETHLPSHTNNETEMSFSISGLDDHFNGNYKCIQSSYAGVFDFGQNPVVHTNATRGITHLFTDATIASEDSYYRSAYNTVWFKDTEQGGLVQYNDWAYNPTTGDYDGNTSTNDTGYTVNHSTTATNSVAYAGEFIEFHFPFLFEISKIKMTSGVYTTFLPSETALLGSSDDGVSWEFIDLLSYARNTVSVINHSVSTSKKYSRFKMIFQQLSNYQGVTIEHLEFEGDVYDSSSVNSTLNSFITSQTATNILVDASFVSLSADIATNVSDITTANTNIATNTTNIATNTTNIATNTTDIATNATNIATNTTNIATNTTDITTANTNIATNTTSINNLSTQINNLDFASKMETLGTHSYNQSTNTISHIYDEKTIHINPLDDNNLMTFDLSINNVSNDVNYVQKVIINCLEFKSYVDTLNINGVEVEIKHKDGNLNINLAPIAGYSMITQTFNILRENDKWNVMSSVRLFYNSASNTAYDVTPPVITLLGDANMNLEINSGAYSEPGFTATDLLDGDISNDVVVSGTVDHTTLGSYNITYNVVDNAGNNAVEKTRVVNVIDTTNPVVTLTGDAEMTVNLNGTYTEEGATASDNSNESLTVVIAGDTVDTSTIGDYTVTYTATDSTGNSHQISRLIHVAINYTLAYSNPSTNILSLPDFYNNLAVDNVSTVNSFTISGNGSAYLNGNYIVEHCGHQSMGYPYKNVFKYDNLSTHWTMFTGSFDLVSHIYGTVDNGGYSYPYSGNDYVGWTSNDGTNVFYSVTATNSQTYEGLYHQIQFPFFVEPSKVSVTLISTWGGPKTIDVLGKNGDGSYDYLGTLTTPSLTENTPFEQSITTSNKYKTIRFVYSTSYVNTIIIRRLELFGDIYT